MGRNDVLKKINYKEKVFNTKDWLQIIFTILVVSAAVVLWGRDIVRMIDWRIPNEIREGANVAVTQALAEGNNPYKKFFFEGGLPNVYYMYPLLNNLIGAAIVSLTGIPCGLTLLILNFLWTGLTGILIAQVVRHYTNSIYLTGLAFLLSHYCGWRYTNVSAFPDMLAVFLMTLILYICVCMESRIKENGRTIILLSALTVLCFYSKQYTVVVAFPVFLFLLVKGNKKTCILYVAATAVLMVVSAFIIYITMPLYFIETLLMVGGSADNELKWALTQFIKIGKLFLIEFFFILCYLIYHIRRKKIKLDYVWISFVTMAVLLLYFGQNNGAHLSYYLQLWMPSVIIVSMQAVHTFLCLAKRNWQKYLVYFVILLGGVYPGFFLNTPLLSNQQKENWNRAMEIAENSELMLATPQMADWAVANKVYLYDYGQNQYILRKEMENFWIKAGESAWIQTIFPEISELKKAHEQYREKMLAQLRDKEYDVLMIVPEVGFIRDFPEFEEIRNANYELTEIIEIETGVWKWEMEVWR